MTPALWPHRSNRPCIEVVLPHSKPSVIRRLVADTGAGNRQSSFQLLLEESDCVRSAGKLMGQVQHGGAYSGLFRVYSVEVSIPVLNFVDNVPVVGVSVVPGGFDGIAAFRFLNRFHYGNFANPDSFGLE